LLAQHPSDNKQRFNQCHQVGEVRNKLFNPCLKPDRPHDADFETEVAQSGAEVILNGNGLRLQQLAVSQ
jgi:hypothetical protein